MIMCSHTFSFIVGLSWFLNSFFIQLKVGVHSWWHMLSFTPCSWYVHPGLVNPFVSLWESKLCLSVLGFCVLTWIIISFSSPRFKKRFLQYNQTISETTLQDIDPKTLERIRELNRLDVELYEYAHGLLRKRFEMLKTQDPHFEEHYENMGNINFSWENLN